MQVAEVDLLLELTFLMDAYQVVDLFVQTARGTYRAIEFANKLTGLFFLILILYVILVLGMGVLIFVVISEVFRMPLSCSREDECKEEYKEKPIHHC